MVEALNGLNALALAIIAAAIVYLVATLKAVNGHGPAWAAFLTAMCMFVAARLMVVIIPFENTELNSVRVAVTLTCNTLAYFALLVGFICLHRVAVSTRHDVANHHRGQPQERWQGP